MKAVFALLPFLFLVGCSGAQKTWRVEEWGTARDDAQRIGALEVEPLPLPARIEGDVEPGDADKWAVAWPVELQRAFVAELNEEASERGLHTRAGEAGGHKLRIVLTLLDVGAPYGTRIMAGEAFLTRQDGVLVAKLHLHHTDNRMFTPNADGQAKKVAIDFARWLGEQR